MRLITHPPDTQQFVGILLSIFGVILGAILYFGGLRVWGEYGGAVLSQEKQLLALFAAGVTAAFLAIGYSFSKE